MRILLALSIFLISTSAFAAKKRAVCDQLLTNHQTLTEVLELTTDRLEGVHEGRILVENLARQMVLEHPSSVVERRQVIHALAEKFERQGELKNSVYAVFDELLGIPRTETEMIESTEEREAFPTLGVGADHDWWFTHPADLIKLIAGLRSAGVRSVVDLGSGTGRLGLLIGFLAPEIKFEGIELYGPRVEAGEAAVKRWGFKNVKFHQRNLLDQSIPYPKADLYFIFGPTNVMSINKRVVERLKREASGRKIVVVSNHHMTAPYLGIQKWLKREREEKSKANTVVPIEWFRTE